MIKYPIWVEQNIVCYWFDANGQRVLFKQALTERG